MTTTKIKNDQIVSMVVGESDDIYDFPKYSTQILNLANSNAGGTRPKIVGQMTELFDNFQGTTFDDWKHYYLDRHPNALADATERVLDMVEKWVYDLVVKNNLYRTGDTGDYSILSVKIMGRSLFKIDRGGRIQRY